MTTTELYGLGVRSVVHCEGEDAERLATRLGSLWARCLTPRGGEVEGGTFRVRLTTADRRATSPSDDGALHLHADDENVLLQQLTQAVTSASIRAQRGSLLMLHAGAVTDPRSGRAVAYVAPGGTGKTTMTRLLGQTHGYVTDETVGLTADGRVLPYEKPLSIRPAPYHGVKIETSPDALGLLPAHPDAQIGRLTILRRSDDASPSVEPLDVADAIAAIVPESSSLATLPRPLHLLADLIDRQPPPLLIRYSEAESVRDVVLTALEEAR